MRILIFGAGVLGCNLARDFHRAGKDVTLLARGEWADEIRNNGLRIKGIIFETNDKIRIIKSLERDDRYDVIFVVMQFTQIRNVIPAIRDNISENIIFIGNNMDANYCVQTLNNKKVWFGFASSAGRREDTRVVSVSMHKVTIGSARGNCENEEFIRDIFDGSRVKVVISENMDEWLKTHAAFILPLAKACYECDGNLKKIRNNEKAINHIIDEMTMYYEAIMRCGYNVVPRSEYEYVTVKRNKCFKFIKLMCGTIIGKIAICDHALSARSEMTELQDAMNEMLKMSN